MTMNVNALSQYLAANQSKTEAGRESDATFRFLDAVVKQCVPKVSATRGETTADNRADMDIEQYKSYIYDAISQIPLNPSQALSNISVTISDAGFEAMKHDPKYEKWVLDGLKQAFSSYNPWVNVCGGAYQTHFFGATEQSYRGESWYPGYGGGIGGQLFEEKSDGGFWEKRMDRQKKRMELLEEEWMKKQLMEARQRRQIITGPDGEKKEYVSGVPASVLLSMLM